MRTSSNKAQNKEGVPINRATEDKQDDILAELEKKADLTETQPVSAASLPLPTGASTEAKQDATIVAIDNIADNQVATNLEGLGDVTVGTSEVEIAITGTPTESIRIQADNGNTGIIYIGKTGVLSDGSNDFVRLESGDDVIMSYDDATNAIFAISDTAAQLINVGVLL